jgi:hypothetical protein
MVHKHNACLDNLSSPNYAQRLHNLSFSFYFQYSDDLNNNNRRHFATSCLQLTGTQMPIHTDDAHPHRCPSSQMPIHTDAHPTDHAHPHRCPPTQMMPILTDAHPHRCPSSQMPIHTDDAHPHRCPSTQMNPIHIDDAHPHRCPFIVRVTFHWFPTGPQCTFPHFYFHKWEESQLEESSEHAASMYWIPPQIYA